MRKRTSSVSKIKTTRTLCKGFSTSTDDMYVPSCSRPCDRRLPNSLGKDPVKKEPK
jgi:hypothetical protein